MAKILITEDEDALRIFVARALKLDGHETVEAGDGAAGLEALRDGAFDLLLSDIRMPVMDGISLLRRIRAEPSDVPVIAFTGNLGEEQRHELQNLGVRRILAKPFLYEEFADAVSTALGAGHVERRPANTR